MDARFFKGVVLILAVGLTAAVMPAAAVVAPTVAAPAEEVRELSGKTLLERLLQMEGELQAFASNVVKQHRLEQKRLEAIRGELQSLLAEASKNSSYCPARVSWVLGNC